MDFHKNYAPVNVMDWAASTLMRTPVSAPTRAPFVQQQLSPISSEEEFTYDSAVERKGLDCASNPPPYDADTELAKYTARSAKRRADSPGDRDVYVSPGPAYLEGYPGGESPPAGQTACDKETLDAHSTRMD